MKYIMKSLGILMKIAMTYPRYQNDMIMRFPGIHMKVTMNYSRDQNEIHNEILKHSYENCNEIS
jgi:hypothetical protein